MPNKSKSWANIDKSTKKGILFSVGVLLSVISVFNFNKSPILAFIGILVAIFFIVKALS